MKPSRATAQKTEINNTHDSFITIKKQITTMKPSRATAQKTEINNAHDSFITIKKQITTMKPSRATAQKTEINNAHDSFITIKKQITTMKPSWATAQKTEINNAHDSFITIKKQITTMKNRYIYWLAPAALLALASCKGKAKQDAAQPPTSVSVIEAKKAEAIYYDQYQGTVVSINTVELRSQVAGFVTGIFFKEGDVVSKGKVLYEIDKRKYQAAYQQAQANVLSAQANLVKAQKDIDRYNMLLKNDAIARQTVDQAEAAFETNKGQVAVAKAALESARTDLSFATITAPFTGRIGISQVRLGTQVSAGTTLMNTISAEHPIGVDVVINEQDIDRFYKLQKSSTDSTFKLQLSDGNTTYNKPGKVLAIDRGVNNQTGTIKVRVQFPNEQDVLKDGMSCVLKVLNNQSGNRVQIPYKAVTEQMGEFFVFVSKDTTITDTTSKDKTKSEALIAKQHKVMLGPRVGSDVVIMSGVESGEKVVTEGFQRLRDGGKITLGGPAPAAAPGQAKQQEK